MCTGITCDITGEPARLEADVRNRRLGPLVQHPPPPPRLGWHHATTSRKPTHNDTNGSGLNKPPQNPGLDKQREGHCTRYMALHPLRGATPVTVRYTRSEGVSCLRIGCAPNHKNKRGICETIADTPPTRRRPAPHAANPPLPNSRPLHRGRILTVPMESAPAGQVAVAGAVERPESDDGNHPSKSRT